MNKVIQATEANRHFSRILREVEQGDSFTVTSHGRPIARIVPATSQDREAAKQRFLEYLRQQPLLEMGPFRREDLYDC
ncbi:MAG TPA: type II toxin-antitoxin system prevent-host-death family antitoxin [Acetobacteraceae bacterium]|jgi:prevent-host-death family protein|nr:type II toxin-antitoxin system prevent-host-death family antitoxin [Acetobacteraceae bacterium]